MNSEVENVKKDIYLANRVMSEIRAIILNTWSEDQMLTMSSEVVGIMTIALVLKISQDQTINIEWLEAFQSELSKILTPPSH